MTRSDDVVWEARVQLAQIRSSLDNLNLSSTIDAPLDIAVDRACERADRSDPPPSLQDLAAQLVADAYRNGPPQLGLLPHDHALAEAILVLERGYVGFHGRGYHASLVDAQSHPNGVAFVLQSLGEALKLRFRIATAERAVARIIDRCSWETKCDMVRCLQVEYGDVRAAAIMTCPPEQFARHIAQLVMKLHGV